MTTSRPTTPSSSAALPVDDAIKALRATIEQAVNASEADRQKFLATATAEKAASTLYKVVDQDEPFLGEILAFIADLYVEKTNKKEERPRVWTTSTETSNLPTRAPVPNLGRTVSTAATADPINIDALTLVLDDNNNAHNVSDSTITTCDPESSEAHDVNPQNNVSTSAPTVRASDISSASQALASVPTIRAADVSSLHQTFNSTRTGNTPVSDSRPSTEFTSTMHTADEGAFGFNKINQLINLAKIKKDERLLDLKEDTHQNRLRADQLLAVLLQSELVLNNTALRKLLNNILDDIPVDIDPQNQLSLRNALEIAADEVMMQPNESKDKHQDQNALMHPSHAEVAAPSGTEQENKDDETQTLELDKDIQLYNKLIFLSQSSPPITKQTHQNSVRARHIIKLFQRLSGITDDELNNLRSITDLDVQFPDEMTHHFRKACSVFRDQRKILFIMHLLTESHYQHLLPAEKSAILSRFSDIIIQRQHALDSIEEEMQPFIDTDTEYFQLEEKFKNAQTQHQHKLEQCIGIIAHTDLTRKKAEQKRAASEKTTTPVHAETNQLPSDKYFILNLTYAIHHYHDATVKQDKHHVDDEKNSPKRRRRRLTQHLEQKSNQPFVWDDEQEEKAKKYQREQRLKQENDQPPPITITPSTDDERQGTMQEAASSPGRSLRELLAKEKHLAAKQQRSLDNEKSKEDKRKQEKDKKEDERKRLEDIKNDIERRREKNRIKTLINEHLKTKIAKANQAKMQGSLGLVNQASQSHSSQKDTGNKTNSSVIHGMGRIERLLSMRKVEQPSNESSLSQLMSADVEEQPNIPVTIAPAKKEAPADIKSHTPLPTMSLAGEGPSYLASTALQRSLANTNSMLLSQLAPKKEPSLSAVPHVKIEITPPTKKSESDIYDLDQLRADEHELYERARALALSHSLARLAVLDQATAELKKITLNAISQAEQCIDPICNQYKRVTGADLVFTVPLPLTGSLGKKLTDIETIHSQLSKATNLIKFVEDQYAKMGIIDRTNESKARNHIKQSLIDFKTEWEKRFQHGSPPVPEFPNLQNQINIIFRVKDLDRRRELLLTLLNAIHANLKPNLQLPNRKIIQLIKTSIDNVNQQKQSRDPAIDVKALELATAKREPSAKEVESLREHMNTQLFAMRDAYTESKKADELDVHYDATFLLERINAERERIYPQIAATNSPEELKRLYKELKKAHLDSAHAFMSKTGQEKSVETFSKALPSVVSQKMVTMKASLYAFTHYYADLFTVSYGEKSSQASKAIELQQRAERLKINPVHGESLSVVKSQFEAEFDAIKIACVDLYKAMISNLELKSDGRILIKYKSIEHKHEDKESRPSEINEIKRQTILKLMLAGIKEINRELYHSQSSYQVLNPLRNTIAANMRYIISLNLENPDSSTALNNIFSKLRREPGCFYNQEFELHYHTSNTSTSSVANHHAAMRYSQRTPGTAQQAIPTHLRTTTRQPGQ